MLHLNFVWKEDLSKGSRPWLPPNPQQQTRAAPPAWDGPNRRLSQPMGLGWGSRQAPEWDPDNPVLGRVNLSFVYISVHDAALWPEQWKSGWTDGRKINESDQKCFCRPIIYFFYGNKACAHKPLDTDIIPNHKAHILAGTGTCLMTDLLLMATFSFYFLSYRTTVLATFDG